MHDHIVHHDATTLALKVLIEIPPLNTNYATPAQPAKKNQPSKKIKAPDTIAEQLSFIYIA